MKLLLPGLIAALAGASAFAQPFPPAERDLATDPSRRDVTFGADDDDEAEGIPELYEDELSDVGPAVLLLAEKARQVLKFYADFQSYFTTNIAQQENTENSGNVSVTTLQLEAWPWETEAFGGEIQTRFGIRHQWYHYGLFGGDDELLFGGLQTVDDLNFNALTGFMEGRYSRGPWFGAFGFEYTRLTDGDTGNETYSEAVPYLRVGYRYELSNVSQLYAEWDSRYRATTTQFAFPGADEDINDRHDQAINLVYSHLFIDKVVAQLSYRFQYSGYTNGSPAGGNEDRDDITNTVSLTAVYYPIDEVAIRAFTTFQRRDSDANGFTFEAGQFGGGLNATVSF